MNSSKISFKWRNGWSRSSWKTCGGKTEGAHDQRMKRLFTPSYDRSQSCAHISFTLCTHCENCYQCKAWLKKHTMKMHIMWKLLSPNGSVKDTNYSYCTQYSPVTKTGIIVKLGWWNTLWRCMLCLRLVKTSHNPLQTLVCSQHHPLPVMMNSAHQCLHECNTLNSSFSHWILCKHISLTHPNFYTQVVGVVKWLLITLKCTTNCNLIVFLSAVVFVKCICSVCTGYDWLRRRWEFLPWLETPSTAALQPVAACESPTFDTQTIFVKTKYLYIFEKVYSHSIRRLCELHQSVNPEVRCPPSPTHW